MPFETPLITMLALAFVIAFAFGFVARQFRLSPLVGYLLAGIAVGPYTPGYVADTVLAQQLAEVGVILLMFGVGLHFSPRDLTRVHWIAIPGALAQIIVASVLGFGLAQVFGWGVGGGVVFGLALSVASTVVLRRALEARGEMDSEHGRIAVAWLVVEDVFMVAVLLFLPALADTLGGRPAAFATENLAFDLLLTVFRIAAFAVLAVVVGRRAIPWLLQRVAATESPELFTLAVLACALGIAWAAALLFDISFAVSAFFAGVIMNESEVSRDAARRSLPFRDAFAVLFFVSVGMLFDPSLLTDATWPLLAVLLIIIIGKSLAAFLIVLAMRHPLMSALTVSASLAQIGEFSFILVSMGVSYGLLPMEGRDLVLAGAFLSIASNPLLFRLLAPVESWLRERPDLLRRLGAKDDQEID
ncbi:cation:proton antiporter [uncultured Ferrovibrio sp.]|jgi:CPA2 family monovalent cation:H+ antiporter-2|uniref:cation:proton antiporter domain-containing protein n=1 Tax=uncultured Ferrovibrio sp. TaxID=1576913 RepID=UPI00261F2910|nr:cation:proton antiporter [uncultured Ferrovibrio sp.]